MKNKKFVITVVSLLICFIVSSIIMVMANRKFSETLIELGGEIPQQIKNTQEEYIQNHDVLLKSIAVKITEKRQAKQDINIDNLKKMFEEYRDILGIESIKMYAVIDGTFYSSDSVKDMEDYTNLDWYKKANENPGQIIYTDAYLYNGTKEKVVTAALKLEKSNDTIAVNIFPERIDTWPDIEEFPNGISYYIADRNGKIIHQDNSNPNLSADETKAYIRDLYPDLDVEEELKNTSTTFVQQSNKQKTGLYVTETYNGWIIVVMIPYEHMLGGIRSTLFAYYTTTVLFSILAIYLTLSERTALKGKSLYNRITKTLGDSYYALYLVDFEKEQYSILKGSEYINDAIPKNGNYEVFMDCMQTIMEKEAFKEFKDTFSIQNIRRLVRNNVSTYGGDFKRNWGSEFQWVNVQMLYSEENIKTKKREVIFAFQNVDKKKERELEEREVLLESIETMQLATQTKNRFFANMSHDMRTPLNAIINLSNLAKEKIDNEEKLLDYLEKINISSTQLLELINSILEVSKIEENMPIINKVEFNIKQRLEKTLSVFEEQAKTQKKELKITMNIKHDYVLSDWGKIRQILNNVLSNALKYTRTNGKIFVEITEIEGKFVSKYEFRIVDNGIGMSKEFLDKIYTPFERETRFHSEEMSGTGLGMAIVQSNVQKFNGQIEIKSEPGKGSEIRIILPLETSTATEHEENVTNNENLEDLKGKNILLVEDNELNMEIATEILEMQGVRVTKALDGKQAVEVFLNSKEGYFDAILMDIQMPIMDGYEATKAIRNLARKDAKTVIILAVTANTFAEDIIEAEKAGMNDHIAKPIDFKALQKALTQNIRNKSK